MSEESRIRRNLSNTAEVDRLLRRIRCQIEFGRAIDDGRFTAALDSAEAAYRSYKSSNDLAEGVTEAETHLKAVAEEAKTFTIHCVGHGHIDMNWMWSWPETCATTHDTFASVLALMDEYPELTYSQSQASVYALVEKYHPEMFSRIKERVREGRWEVAAVHWVEGDKNLASGEALAHHLLYTRRYFQEKFRLSPEDCQLDWDPDTFGHCNTLPGILRQGGVKYYYCCRPGGGQEHVRVGDERPPIFWWQSPDGSRVLVNKETTWYNSYVEIGDNFALPAAAFFKKTGLRDWLNVYGIGNHGGGPTRAEIDFFIETRDWPCWPNVVFGTAQGYMRKIEPLCGDMPVIDHELNFEFTGCYTSQSAIKKANRYGENYCVEAETLAVLERGLPARSGDLEGRDPRSLLRDAWINVLFNQFHDILPGSGVAATRNHALGLFQETGAITGAIKRNALQTLARDLDTASLLPDTPEAQDERALLNSQSSTLNPHFEAGAGQGAGESGISRASGGGHRFRPVMIYNPCAWERTELVEVNLYDLPEDIPADRIVALDETGAVHPTLDICIISGGNHDWGHRRTTLLFEAKDVPALGYRTFLFCEGAPTPESAKLLCVNEREYETPNAVIEFEKFGSGVAAYSVKASGATFSGGHWEFDTEWPTGMSAWLLGGNTGGAPVLKSSDGLDTTRFLVHGITKNEATSLAQSKGGMMVVRNEMNVPGTDSTVTTNACISAAHDWRVAWEAWIDWREIGSSTRGIPGLTVSFTTAEADDDNNDDYLNRSAVYETAFGTVTRPGSRMNEVPSLRFTHRWSEGAGLTLVQDSKYGHSFFDNRLQLRVLRSSYEPDHAPEVAKSTMRYAVVFHDSQPTNAELVRLGAAFNHPLMVVPVLLQEGKQPTKRSFAETKTESVVLSTMKLGEDGGLVLRLVNYADDDVEAVVELAPELLGSLSRATPVDLMERPFEGEARLEEKKLTVKIRANSFATAKLE